MNSESSQLLPIGKQEQKEQLIGSKNRIAKDEDRSELVYKGVEA